jgi:geranylgeranyl pyrophosphate synthase
MGKTVGKDAQHGKRTHVALLSLEGARRLGQELTASAVAALDGLGDSAGDLKSLACLLEERTR